MLKQSIGIPIPGICCRCLEYTDDHIPFMHPKNTQQATACRIRSTGFHAPGLFVVKGTVSVQHKVGTSDPNLGTVFKFQISTGQLYCIPNGRGVQTNCGDGSQICHTGIMIIIVVSVSMDKVGIHKPQTLGLAVHFFHKDILSLLGIQIRVLSNDSAGYYRQNMRRITAAGNQHCPKHRLHRHPVTGVKPGLGSISRNDGQHIRSYGNYLVKLQIFQRSIGIHQLGNAGRVQLGIRRTLHVQILIAFAIVHKSPLGRDAGNSRTHSNFCGNRRIC